MMHQKINEGLKSFFMIQVLIEQVNTLAVLTLNCPLKVILNSFENSREAYGL